MSHQHSKISLLKFAAYMRQGKFKYTMGDSVFDCTDDVDCKSCFLDSSNDATSFTDLECKGLKLDQKDKDFLMINYPEYFL